MRTEGDTWDIVSSVGRTALGVAACRALETRRPDPLIRDEFAALFVDAAGDQKFTEFVANPPETPYGPLLPSFSMGLRTRFFDEFFEDATHRGAPQAVILAAGLDARAYRLNWPAGTTVFEIDQPRVLEFKSQVLTENNAQPTAIRREVAVDLRDDWPGALAAAGFDAGKPTAWSAEGLLVYLPGAAQDALFDRVGKLSAPGSSFALETIPPGTDITRFTDVQKKLFGKTSLGEDDFDVTQLFYNDERKVPDQWFADNGWSVRGFDPEQLAAEYGRPISELDLPEDFPPDLAILWQQPRYSIATLNGYRSVAVR